MQYTAIIRNWTVVKTLTNGETHLYIKGNIYEDKRESFSEDGDLVVTSAIILGQDGYVQTYDGVFKLE